MCSFYIFSSELMLFSQGVCHFNIFYCALNLNHVNMVVFNKWNQCYEQQIMLHLNLI